MLFSSPLLFSTLQCPLNIHVQSYISWRIVQNMRTVSVKMDFNNYGYLWRLNRILHFLEKRQARNTYRILPQVLLMPLMHISLNLKMTVVGDWGVRIHWQALVNSSQASHWLRAELQPHHWSMLAWKSSLAPGSWCILLDTCFNW